MMRDRPMPGRRTAWVVAALLLALGGSALVVEGMRSVSPPAAEARVRIAPPEAADGTPAPGPESEPGPEPEQPESVAAGRMGPARLSIPAIGLSHRLLRLGLNADGTVEVPSSRQADLPGWYRLGPAPGQLGSAVILGHVDSVRGPAVFHALRELERGDRVDVGLSDGRVARFGVLRLRTYPNEDFPVREVYGPRGYAGLQLVTCTGAYDAADGYQANLVVYTRLERILPSTTGNKSPKFSPTPGPRRRRPHL